MNVKDLKTAQFDRLTELLCREKLPVSDLYSAKWFALLGIEDQDELIAAGGLEKCGSELLLRSVVVAPQFRGNGLAQRVANQLHMKARSADYRNIYLMTMDAELWFAKYFIYQIMERTEVPEDIAASSQFSRTCPGSASLMMVSI